MVGNLTPKQFHYFVLQGTNGQEHMKSLHLYQQILVFYLSKTTSLCTSLSILEFRGVSWISHLLLNENPLVEVSILRVAEFSMNGLLPTLLFSSPQHVTELGFSNSTNMITSTRSLMKYEFDSSSGMRFLVTQVAEELRGVKRNEPVQSSNFSLCK